MGQVLSLPFKLLKHTSTFYRGFVHYWCGSGRHSPFEFGAVQSSFRPLHPQPEDLPSQRLFKQQARIHLYTLAANFYLYHKPHYRKGKVDIHLLYSANILCGLWRYLAHRIQTNV